MENERQKKLKERMKKFNKDRKSEIFTFGNEIQKLPVISTGIEEFDKFIGGGFKMGGHTIVWGTYSVGKTAMIMHTIATAQKEGKLVCYVNTEKPIEPERFKFFGIDLNNLVYIEAPESAEDALEALRTLCKDKLIDLFIIDSTNGLCPQSVKETKTGSERGLEKKNVASLPLVLSNFYNVVNSHVFNSRASVVWIGQARTKGIGSFFTHLGLSGGNAQEFYAYQIVFMRRGSNDNNPKRIEQHYFLDTNGKVHRNAEKIDCGFNVVCRLEKTNSCESVREKQEICIPFYYDSGFKLPDNQEEKIVIDGTDEDKEIITKYLIEKGIIQNESLAKNVTQEELINAVETSTAIEGVNINLKKKRGRGRPAKKEKK